MPVHPNDVAKARGLLIEKAQTSKHALHATLDNGQREYDRMRVLLEEFISHLTAADVLAGHDHVESNKS